MASLAALNADNPLEGWLARIQGRVEGRVAVKLRTKVVLLNKCSVFGDIGIDSVLLLRRFKTSKTSVFRVLRVTAWDTQDVLGNYRKRQTAVAAFEKACFELGAKPARYGPNPFAWRER